MKKSIGLLAVLALSTASALTIIINGTPVPGTTITVGGKTYVPLDSLKAAGMTSSVAGGKLSLSTTGAGGSTQIAALQGCLNQTLFNGVWRAKFSNLRMATIEGTPRWVIDAEIRNATNMPLSGMDGALFADEQHLSWVQADGTPLAWGTTDILIGQKFTFANLPPAGAWKGTLTNVDSGNTPSDARKPTKLLWQINNTTESSSSLRSKLPWTKNPSFRIDLTCTK